MKSPAGKMNKKIRIEQPVADSSFDGAGSGSWTLVRDVWAELEDVMPSRDERLNEGIIVSSRRTRVRMWHRPEITSAMRVVIKKTGRILQIVGGPASIENGARLEIMAEEFNPAGNGA